MSYEWDPTTNSTTVQVWTHTSHFYRHHRHFIDVLSNLVYGVVLPGLFTAVVTSTTLLTVFRLRQVLAWRSQTSSNVTSAREVALTRMLIVTSWVFVACYFPIILFRMISFVEKDLAYGRKYHNIFRAILSVNEMMTYMNSSLNFFVYCSVGSRYRQVLRHCLLCRDVQIENKAEVTAQDSLEFTARQ